MLTVAVAGPPQAGKSTLFAAIAGPGVKGDRAVVSLPDPRLPALAKLYDPKKVTAVQTCFFDAPVGSPALQEADALCLVVRCFRFLPDEKLDPVATLRGLWEEFILEDMKRVENRLARLRKMKGQRATAEERECQVLEKLLPHLEREQPVRSFPMDPEDEKRLRGFCFLTAKPVIAVANLKENERPEAELAAMRELAQGWGWPLLELCATLEAEVAALASDEEKREFLAAYGVAEPVRDRLLRLLYEHLQYLTFFTVGPDEVRGWPLKRGSCARTAAGTIHSDLERGFIRADVAHCDTVLAAGSFEACRSRKELRCETAGYEVKDGDCLEIKFNV